MKQEKKYILTGYCHPSCRPYNPRLNNKKRLAVVGAWLVSLAIPFTTAPFTMAVGLIAKYKPLWFFQ